MGKFKCLKWVLWTSVSDYQANTLHRTFFVVAILPVSCIQKTVQLRCQTPARTGSLLFRYCFNDIFKPYENVYHNLFITHNLFNTCYNELFLRITSSLLLMVWIFNIFHSNPIKQNMQWVLLFNHSFKLG